MKDNKPSVIVTTDNGHILRNRTIKDLNEVAALHAELPGRFLGVFFEDMMWLWVPEMGEWRDFH